MPNHYPDSLHIWNLQIFGLFLQIILLSLRPTLTDFAPKEHLAVVAKNASF